LQARNRSFLCAIVLLVIAPETGVLAPPASAEQLAAAMAGFLAGHHRFDPVAIPRSAEERFGGEAFAHQLAGRGPRCDPAGTTGRLMQGPFRLTRPAVP
jgi:hypothetical protein